MRYTLFSTPMLSPTLRIISRGILKVIRWRVSGSLPEDQKKYVLIVAPHTSNWDFILGISALFALNVNIKWLGKNSLTECDTFLVFSKVHDNLRSRVSIG